MAGAISGIGGFRSPGDPRDARYGYGEVPQEAAIIGLPNGNVAIRLDYAGIPNNSARARSGGTPKQRAEASRLRQEANNPVPRSVDRNPRERRSGLAPLLLGESDVGMLQDARMKGAPRRELRAEDVLMQERGQDNPAIAIEYGDYAYGMPRDSSFQDVTLSDNDRYGTYTAEDPTQRGVRAEWGTDIAPFGTVDVPSRQIGGQWAAVSGPNRGRVAIQRIDPTATAYTRVGNPDSPYSSEQSEEVSYGRAAKEAKQATEPPIIGESALLQKGFVSAEKLPTDVLELYAQGGELGTFVGMAETARSERYPASIGRVESGKTYVPVYRAERWDPVAKAKVQLTGTRDIPRGEYEVEQISEPLYRLGQPSSYDMAMIAEELGPLMGVRTVRTPAEGARKTIGFPEVQAIAKQQGYQVFADPRLEREIRPEAIDGTVPVYFKKPDGSTSQLTPRLNEAGKPTGAFTLTGAYSIENEVGPGPLSSDAGIRKFIGNKNTYIDNSRRGIGQLGENAISTEQFLNDLIAGSFMEEPDTRNAYRDILAPMVARGELDLDDPRLVGQGGRPLFAPGSQSRALVEQALIEMGQRRIDPNRPVIGGGDPLSPEEIAMARDIQVMASGEDIRKAMAQEAAAEIEAELNPLMNMRDDFEASEEGAADGSMDRRNRSGMGIVRDPGAATDAYYAAAKQRALEALQARLDDSDARVRPYQGNAGQAEMLAEIAMRQGGDLDAEIGKLLGGEVRGEFNRRIGSGVTGRQAEEARRIREGWQGRAPGLPYDRELADAGLPQMSYSQMATELNSSDPDKQERAMQALQGVIRARTEQAALSDARHRELYEQEVEGPRNARLIAEMASGVPREAVVNTEKQSMINAPAPSQGAVSALGRVRRFLGR